MKTPAEILKEAKKATAKDTLELHRQTILTLREKNYSWREVAEFLCERGVATDHSKVFRFITKPRRTKMDAQPEFKVPIAADYRKALEKIESKMSEKQRKMLKAHFHAPNRTATYTELAEAVGYDTYHFANSNYGGLAKMLGTELGVSFVHHVAVQPEMPFLSFAIGMPMNFKERGWALIMHHELADALRDLPGL